MALDTLLLSNPIVSELTSISLNEFLDVILPLFVFVVGLVIYAVFIFKFYRFLARRDILRLNLPQYSQGLGGFIKTTVGTLLYIAETIILTPLFVSFWFAVMALLLIILSKVHSAQTLLLTSVALVAAVRITAYYNENLSQDLSKLIPFALLAVFIVDIPLFSISSSLEIAKQILPLWKNLVYYLLFVILLEFFMRMLLGISHLVYPAGEAPPESLS
jgi:hypothetical protein